MAVPSSGELKMSGIYAELNENEYTAFDTEGEEASLLNLSTGGDPPAQNINTGNLSKPDGIAPHSMSEFNAFSNFTITANLNTAQFSALKTFQVVGGSGQLTCDLIDQNSSSFGTLAVSISSQGDPGTGGTSNNATGFVGQGTQASLSLLLWNATQTFYVRFKFTAHSFAATDAFTARFRVTGVTGQQLDRTVTKVSNDPGRSDIRFKTNINKIGYSNIGIPIYLFNYKEDLNTTYKGVMAQDLLNIGFEDSVSIGEDGYYRVDYSMIDVNLEKI
jgi:hypothetical protein